MLSFNKKPPEAFTRDFAARFRARRLAYGWSREELGARAGIAVPTLRVFEDTGKISLERFFKLAHALGVLDEFADIAASPPTSLRSLADMEAEAARPRRRGRTSAHRRA